MPKKQQLTKAKQSNNKTKQGKPKQINKINKNNENIPSTTTKTRTSKNTYKQINKEE